MSLAIDTREEAQRIAFFIKNILAEQKIGNAVIGISGGIDSSVSLALLEKSISPKNIFVAHLYYFESQINFLKPFLKKTNIPQKNIYNISIKNAVDEIKEKIELTKTSKDFAIRLGNIMSRVRMTVLYDLAKKHNGLVCGTENKSEFLLGYFTRFGDEASDFEPIRHLYKTQIYQLADSLDIPKEIINLAPTAGLHSGQTDEKDFGFSYREADIVLRLYFEEKNTVPEILKKGYKNAQKIIDRSNRNSFKHHLPYTP